MNKLIAFIGASLLSVGVAQAATVGGTIVNATGIAQGNGTVTFALTGCPVTQMTGPVSPVIGNYIFTANANGSWSGSIVGNDLITCPGNGVTQYKVSQFTATGQLITSQLFSIPNNSTFNPNLVNSTPQPAQPYIADPITAEGDLIYGGPQGIPTRLPIGANGTCLESNGTTPYWNTNCGTGGSGGSGGSNAGAINITGTNLHLAQISNVSGTYSIIDSPLALSANGTTLTYNGTINAASEVLSGSLSAGAITSNGSAVCTQATGCSSSSNGVTTFSVGSWPSFLVPVVTNNTTTPNLSVIAGVVPVANGGTGTASPGLVAGANVTITGSWPNQTITASGGNNNAAITFPSCLLYGTGSTSAPTCATATELQTIFNTAFGPTSIPFTTNAGVTAGEQVFLSTSAGVLISDPSSGSGGGFAMSGGAGLVVLPSGSGIVSQSVTVNGVFTSPYICHADDQTSFALAQCLVTPVSGGLSLSINGTAGDSITWILVRKTQ